jgi:serine/threonine protein kinase/WD40 repeat protein
MLSQKSEESIFHAARVIESESDRSTFLDRECANDQKLRKRLDALLAAHLNDPDYLHVSPIDCESFSGTPSELELTACLGKLNQPGDVIGPYKIREQIGEGGMGVVYVAEQTEPVKRRVALKVIKPGMDSKQVIARFEAERQALAMMDHPNIARVIDGGTTVSGRPYFAMDLVRGLPISEYCDKHRLDTRDRLKLFVDVCDAVQHAHQKGIIHRDLKPTNVLVTRNADRAIPKVIDFGLAKATAYRLTERSIYTNFHQMIGTPLYMSPEQAELSELDVDIRSDIYSLGVILYELVTGNTPFDRDRLGSVGYDEIRRIIREEDPPRPSEKVSTLKAEAITTLCDVRQSDFAKIRQQLRGELDWVVMKALDKDRRRRYQSASEFADDVRRFLNDETVEACPPTLSYRLGKYTRRHRVLVASAALVMLAAASATSISLVFANRAMIAAVRAQDLAEERDAAANEMSVETERANRAEEQERRLRLAAQRALYQADIRVTDSHLQRNADADALMTLLDFLPTEGNEDLRAWEWYYLLGSARVSERGWHAHHTGVSAEWLSGGIVTIGWNSRGKWEGYLWDPSDGSLLQTLDGWRAAVRDHRRSRIAGTWRWNSSHGEKIGFQISDFATNEKQYIRLSNIDSVWAPMLWDRQGNRFAVFAEGTKIFRYKSEQWEQEHALDDVIRIGGWSNDDRYFVGVNTGQFLVAAPLRLFDGETLKLVKEIVLDVGLWGDVAGRCHPSEQWIALPCSDGRIQILDLETEQRVADLQTGQVIRDLRWSPDGTAIAASGDQGLVQVWAVEDWGLMEEISAYSSYSQTVSWSPDSRRLVSIGVDGYCAIWSLDDQDLNQERKISADDDITSFLWSDDDTIQYSRSQNQIESFRLSDGVTHRLLTSDETGPWGMASADLVLNVSQLEEEVRIELRDLNSRSVQQLKALRATPGTRIWEISPDGQKLAIAAKPPGGVCEFELIEIETGQSRPIELKGVRFCAECAWSPDGRQIAFVGSGSNYQLVQTIHIVDVATEMTIRHKKAGFLGWGNQLQSVAWSPDGSKLVVGGMDGRCEILDSHSLAKIVDTRPSAGKATEIAWHPSDNRVASSSASRTVALWDANSGQTLLKFKVDDVVQQLKWSPSGQRLAALLASGQIMIWDASEGYRRSQSNTLAEHRRAREKEKASLQIED